MAQQLTLFTIILKDSSHQVHNNSFYRLLHSPLSCFKNERILELNLFLMQKSGVVPSGLDFLVPGVRNHNGHSQQLS